MKAHEATEAAYKNGYAKGYEDGKRDAVKRGRWEWFDDEECGMHRCSVCYGGVGYPTHFCPDCGADMRGATE